MADLIDRDALEAKIRENSITIRFFDPRDIMIGELCDIKIFDTDNGFVKLEDITHWMPLPEPPEKE